MEAPLCDPGGLRGRGRPTTIRQGKRFVPGNRRDGRGRTRTDADGGATATTFSPPSIIRPPLLPSLLPPFLPNIDSSPFAIIVSSSSSSSPPSRGWENSLRYSAPHCAPYPDPLDFPTAMRSSYVVLSQPLRLQCTSEKGREMPRPYCDTKNRTFWTR